MRVGKSESTNNASFVQAVTVDSLPQDSVGESSGGERTNIEARIMDLGDILESENHT